MSDSFAAANRTKGLTLIEILVVVAIISVLTGLAIPIMARSRAQARRLSCASNLSQLHKAMSIYVSENFATYPRLAARPTMNQGMPRMRDTLIKYAPDERVFKCPEDNKQFFEKEGASYEWNAGLSESSQDGPIDKLISPAKMPMMYDYENFHASTGGEFGGKNVLFCDGHVGH